MTENHISWYIQSKGIAVRNQQLWHSGDISSWIKSIFVSLIFAILISGCVGAKVRTYNVSESQKSEVAVIKGSWHLTPLYYKSIEIYMIDGKCPDATQVEVLPGWHELVILNYTFSFVQLFPGPPTPCVRAAFNCEAGHEYKIKTASFVHKGSLIEIVDVNTGVTIFSGKWDTCNTVLEAYEGTVGVTGIEVTGGLIVKRVASDSPAEKAGVKVGDKLKSVNGIQVKSEREYYATVPFQKVGEKRTYVFERDGKEFTVDMVGEPTSNFLGK
jgi:hypothetical protein